MYLVFNRPLIHQKMDIDSNVAWKSFRYSMVEAKMGTINPAEWSNL